MAYSYITLAFWSWWELRSRPDCWTAPPPPFVLGGTIRKGTGDGSAYQLTTGRRCHVVEPANTVPVCYGNAQDVIFNDGLGPRTIVVSESIVYVGDGVMAPSEDSGCSWTSASLVMPLLYELQVLLSEGPAPYGVNVIIAWT